jgi:sigma-B regulation protein RsbU (phosphoserine phosphatase)
VRFSSLFRPASWVSGDIFDVIRLDENHVGFYVADAVGHGLPAALLTIFIKQALPTKRVAGNSYTIVPPDQAIAELNKAICDQDLSSCQFCTALYGIINVRTLELDYARGGHPPAIWLHADDSTTELDVQGGLLGVFPEEHFEAGRVRLSPGDRLLLHTDGSEEVFRRQGTSGREEFIEVVQRVRHLPLETMMMELTNTIDAQQGSLNPEDDVTLLAVDVAKQ